MTDTTILKGKVETLVEQMQELEWLQSLAPTIQMKVVQIQADYNAAEKESMARAMGLVPDREYRFSGSGVGKCPRGAWLQLHGARGKKYNDRTKVIFRLGDSFENLLMAWIRTVALLDESVVVREDLVQKELFWRGVSTHGDIPATIGGVNIYFEVKTMAYYGYDKLLSAGDMDDEGGYPQQANHVCRALEEETGEEWSKIGWLACNKNTGHWCEIVVDRNDSKYIPMFEHTYAIAHGDFKPSRPAWVKLKNSKINDWRCSYCPVIEHCWDVTDFSTTKKGAPVFTVREDTDGPFRAD